MIYEKSCGAIIFFDGDERYFLIEEMHGGHFALCKGHVERGETEHETAAREIREETGLGVSFIGNFRREVRYRPYAGCIKTVVYFIARAKTMETVRQEEEVASIIWLPYEEALNKLTYSNDKRLLEKAEERLKGTKTKFFEKILKKT